MDMTKELYLALADFDEEFVLETLKARLQGGEPPLSLLKELQKGMNLVGERYEKEYYLSELMLSADLFNRSMGILIPFLSGFMLTSGCECPVDVKRENLMAFVETGKNYRP